jgi:hypothetical protein
LHDHKAFLFSKSKNLLVIPILLAEIDSSKYAGDVPAWAYGDYKFQGAYVFSISPEGGIVLRGRITHATASDESGYYWYNQYSIKRSLYMNNTLYTLSDKMIKANSLVAGAPDEINKIELPAEEERNPIEIL